MANFQRLSGQERTLPSKKPHIPTSTAELNHVSGVATAILPRIVTNNKQTWYLCSTCQKYHLYTTVYVACDETGAVFPVAHMSYGCWCEKCWMALLASI